MIIPAARIVFPEAERRKILEQMEELLASGQLTLGKHGKQLEERFATAQNAKYGIAVSSGTSALEIVLRIIGVEGGEVIMPTNTFIATAAAAAFAGARPVFADASADLSIDPDHAAKLFTPRTRAVVAVHIGGTISPTVERLKEICDVRGVPLIEDAAHAHGSTLRSKHAGRFGRAATCSFYPTKVMTSGEGGLILTDDQEIDRRARVLRDQGKAGFLGNVHTELGNNWRMSELHAVLGLSQLRCLESFIGDRRRIAGRYDERVGELKGVEPIRMSPDSHSNYYKYPVLLPRGSDRASAKKTLKEQHSVSLSGEVYELPVHLQPVMKERYGFRGGELPRAEDLCARQICLPVYAGMTEAEADQVIDSLKAVL